MELAADVRDRTGRVLLSAGIVTEKHIKILRMWGITEADVKGVTPQPHVDAIRHRVDAEGYADAEARVAVLFAHANREHPVMKELERLATIRIALGEQGEHHGS